MSAGSSSAEQRAAASPALDTVVSLTEAALKLRSQAQYARSLEAFRAALAAAKALGGEDCVIAATLASDVALASVYAAGARDAGELTTPAFAAEVLAELRESATLLLRRRDAGRLLPGACSYDEELWHVHYLCSVPPAHMTEAYTEPVVARLAPLVGVAAVLHTASACAMVLSSDMLDQQLSDPDAEPARLELMTFWCAFLEAALAMMAQPRVLPTVPLASERELYTMTQNFLHVLASMAAAYWPLYERLSRDLAQLLESGVAEERGMCGDKVVQALAAAPRNVAHAYSSRAAAAGQLRACALCGTKEEHVAHFSSCAACTAVVYCSKTCQLADWPNHKTACKAAREAAEPDAT